MAFLSRERCVCAHACVLEGEEEEEVPFSVLMPIKGGEGGAAHAHDPLSRLAWGGMREFFGASVSERRR